MFFAIIIFLYFVLFYVYLCSWNEIKTTDDVNYNNTVSVIVAVEMKRKIFLKLLIV